MCLIAWNWQPASATSLLLLANRDEFYHRAASPLHWWEGGQLLAGQDLQAGGTWLGVSRSGRLAALTNYRQPTPASTGTPSRGELVANFLDSETGAAQFLHTLASRANAYNPFNLLVFDGVQLMGLESRHARVLEMPTGVGAVSNADFQTPWPKVTQLKKGLQSCLDQHRTNADHLMALLQDPTQPPDALLPHTGIPLPLERALSAAFIATPHYGTRASSLVRLHRSHAEFFENSYDAGGLICQNHHTFPL
ncbi:MAG: hypothetical protein A3F78_14420 [Burkholderiales bacterium RIFCSPLOWO2_12_FULL_61_40]|nr:MAG: hypothetical protein A3F78_14420 [Burkholderiales bacterium RIFCSPLOWO2_12_FULL_61_40]